MKTKEDLLQIQCIDYLILRNLKYIVSFSGVRITQWGTKRKMKKLGLVSGIPDLQIPYARHGMNGLFIELKVGKNKTSKAQDEYIEFLRSENYQVDVVYDFDRFVMVIDEYFDERY